MDANADTEELRYYFDQRFHDVLIVEREDLNLIYGLLDRIDRLTGGNK